MQLMDSIYSYELYVSISKIIVFLVWSALGKGIAPASS